MIFASIGWFPTESGLSYYPTQGVAGQQCSKPPQSQRCQQFQQSERHQRDAIASRCQFLTPVARQVITLPKGRKNRPYKAGMERVRTGCSRGATDVRAGSCSGFTWWIRRELSTAGSYRGTGSHCDLRSASGIMCILTCGIMSYEHGVTETNL